MVTQILETCGYLNFAFCVFRFASRVDLLVPRALLNVKNSVVQFEEQECSLATVSNYPASRLYKDYRYYCQVLGRKPQSNSAFKKALDKLVNV